MGALPRPDVEAGPHRDLVEALHDLHHRAQVCKAMAWQYKDEVGPWRAYLNTLPRE